MPVDTVVRIGKLLVGCAVTAVLAMAVLFLYLDHPIADDYLVAASARDQGWFGYTFDTVYKTLSGRWSGHALLAFVGGRVDIVGHYSLLLGVLWCVDLLAFYVLVRTVLAEQVSRPRAISLALAFFALLWAARHSPGDTIYWLSGAVPYPLCFSLSIFLLAGLVRPVPDHYGWFRLTVRAVTLAALAAVIMGMHELIGMMVCVALVVGLVMAVWTRSGNRLFWALALAAAAVSLLVVLLAPGNAVRGESRYPDRHNVLITLRVCFELFIKYGTAWLLDPKILSATVLLVVSPRLAAMNPAWLSRSVVPWKWIIPGAWAVMLLGGVVGPSWEFGFTMFARVLDANYTVFMIGWFTTVFVWTRRRGEPTGSEATGMPGLQAAALITFALALITTGNSEKAVADLLRDRPWPWHRAVVQRYDIISRARQEGVADLEVPDLPTRPRLWYKFDGALSQDPNHWGNRATSQYFGLRSIRLATPEQEDQTNHAGPREPGNFE